MPWGGCNRSHPGVANLRKLAFSQGPIAATQGVCRCKSPKSRFCIGRQTPRQGYGFCLRKLLSSRTDWSRTRARRHRKTPCRRAANTRMRGGRCERSRSGSVAGSLGAPRVGRLVRAAQRPARQPGRRAAAVADACRLPRGAGKRAPWHRRLLAGDRSPWRPARDGDHHEAPLRRP